MLRYLIFYIIICTSITINFSFAQSNPSIEFIGSVGGKITDFAIYEDPNTHKIYAYIAQGAAIIIFDVSDHTNPIEINRFFPKPFRINNISISGNMLSIATFGFSNPIYSLKNPINPVLHQIIPFGSDKLYLSGHKISLIVNNRSTGSTRPIFGNSIYDISNLNNPELISSSPVKYNSFPWPPHFIHASNTEFNDPQFYWLTFSPFGWVIWFDIDFRKYPPDLPKYETQIIPRLTKELTTSRPSIFGAVAYKNKLYITFTDRLFSYDPRITNVTPETISIPIPNIIGAPILDKNLIYIPTESEYLIYDLSIPTQPVFSHSTPPSSFEPRYIKNGIAYGFENGQVIIQSINPFEENITPIETEIFNSLDQIEKFDTDESLDKYTVVHPEHIFQKGITIQFQGFDIKLTNGSRDYQGITYDVLYIHDKNFDPENPEYIEAYTVDSLVEPIGAIEDNILSFPAGDAGTFYFRLGGDLFSTSIPNWQLH